MKLQPALIFGEHMILQRRKPIKVWGTSVKDDTVSVTLCAQYVSVTAEEGKWSAVLEPEEACKKTSMIISSRKTGERICFEDVAIGDVFLGGGQSNMEFLMKYDADYPTTKELPGDELLRCFTYPQTAFKGFLEIDSCPEAGFWRRWGKEEERRYFAAIPTYMGMILRKELDVPIGIISCNWGGSPAAAWTAMEDLQAQEELKPILDWHRQACEETDWSKYIPASEIRIPVTKEQQEFTDRFMMGEDMSEFFKNFDPSKLPKLDYAPFNPGPRSVVRPSGLYENMLCKVAPYGLRSFLWYQGEDDDARGWADFYDTSMITLIRSWRKLWQEELPFFQIELAPFRGVGVTGAKKYDLMRHKQAEAAEALNDVHDICILDAGEEYNIHPRRKKMVGERLARIVLKHVYGDTSRTADCPQAIRAERQDDGIVITFANVAEGLQLKGDLREYLLLTADEEPLNYNYELQNDRLLLKGAFRDKESVKIAFCESNFCVDPLYNTEGNPVFGFTFEV